MTAYEFIKLGKKNHSLNNTEEAISNFTNAINLYTKDSDKAEAYRLRGNAKVHQNNNAEAIADFDIAISFDTVNNDKAKFYCCRGYAKVRQNNYNEAIIDFDRAIALHSQEEDKAVAYYYRANAKCDLGDYASAFADYDEAISHYIDNNDKANAYTQRGVAKLEQNDYAAAIADFNQTIDLYTTENDKALAYYYLGIIYLEQQDKSKTISSFLHGWQNPQAPLYIKLHSGMHLKKLGYLDNGDTTIDLTSTITQLAMKLNMSIKERTILSIVSANNNAYEIAHRNCRVLLKHCSLEKIPNYLQKELLQILVQRRMDLARITSPAELKDVATFKIQLYNLIMGLNVKETRLKQNSLAHLLIPTTFLGSINHIPYESEDKQSIFIDLECDIKKNGNHLDKSVKTTLSKALCNDIEKKNFQIRFPNFYIGLLLEEIKSMDNATQKKPYFTFFRALFDKKTKDDVLGQGHVFAREQDTFFEL